LAPEFEAIISIIPFAETHARYRVHHVKGHQKGNNLSWEAQLNNLCDELATTARSLTTKPTAYRLPGAKATLYIQKQEVTSAISTALRHAATTQDLRDYFRKKYHWKDATIASIDWIITSRALKRIYGRAKITLQKFIHEWLPLNGHPGRALHEDAKLCPCCRAATEDHLHFLECNHPSMQPAWTMAAQAIQKSLTDRQSDPFLKKLIMCAVTNWRNTANPPKPTFLPDRYTGLFEEQSRIGWKHFLKGRWSTRWVHHHDEHAKLNKIRQKGDTWSSTTLRHIWENLYDVWKQRCNIQHGNSQQSRRNATLQRLEPRVRAMYGLSERLDHQDKAVLSRPITEILALHPSTLEKWVFRTEQFVRAGVARAKRRDKHSNKSITSFFEPASSPIHLSVATLTAPSPTQPPTTRKRPRLRQATIARSQNQLFVQPTDTVTPPPPPPPPPRQPRKKKLTITQRIQRTTRDISTYFEIRPVPQPPPPDDSTSSTRKANLRPP
jgi:hypothetical protein